MVRVGYLPTIGRLGSGISTGKLPLYDAAMMLARSALHNACRKRRPAQAIPE